MDRPVHSSEKTSNDKNSFAQMLKQHNALVDLASAIRATGYHFVTPTPATHERVNNRSGNEWASSLQDIFGWSRPYHKERLPARMQALIEKASAEVPQDEGWRSLVRLSSLGGQLFMHSLFPTANKDAVFFGPDTYRFAHAIRQHLASHSQRIERVVDIGCGSGAGAILIALACPEAHVLATDINEAALALTRVNAELAGASNVAAAYSNLFSDVEGKFDLIVANPPYLVDDAGRAYRNGGGELGAGLSLAILDAAIERLTPGGHLLLYTGVAIVKGEDLFYQAAHQRLAHEKGRWSWDYEEIDPDVFGEELEREVYSTTDRIAAVLLTVRNRRAAH